MLSSQESPPCTRQIVPFVLNLDNPDKPSFEMGNLLQTMANQFSFMREQCWVFDKLAVDRILSRYSSEHADIFRFIPAFTGKQSDPDFFNQLLLYLGLQDPHYKLRSMSDPFENEPPWYETVCMIIGLKLVEDSKEQISSILIFQACTGEISTSSKNVREFQDVAWFCFLDFFCFSGKNIPQEDDMAAMLQLACSEVKPTGYENLLVVSRSAINNFGDRKRHPGLIPSFVLERFGF